MVDDNSLIRHDHASCLAPVPSICSRSCDRLRGTSCSVQSFGSEPIIACLTSWKMDDGGSVTRRVCGGYRRSCRYAFRGGLQTSSSANCDPPTNRQESQHPRNELVLSYRLEKKTCRKVSQKCIYIVHCCPIACNLAAFHVAWKKGRMKCNSRVFGVRGSLVRLMFGSSLSIDRSTV